MLRQHGRERPPGLVVDVLLARVYLAGRTGDGAPSRLEPAGVPLGLREQAQVQREPQSAARAVGPLYGPRHAVQPDLVLPLMGLRPAQRDRQHVVPVAEPTAGGQVDPRRGGLPGPAHVPSGRRQHRVDVPGEGAVPRAVVVVGLGQPQEFRTVALGLGRLAVEPVAQGQIGAVVDALVMQLLDPPAVRPVGRGQLVDQVEAAGQHLQRTGQLPGHMQHHPFDITGRAACPGSAAVLRQLVQEPGDPGRGRVVPGGQRHYGPAVQQSRGPAVVEGVLQLPGAVEGVLHGHGPIALDQGGEPHDPSPEPQLHRQVVLAVREGGDQVCRGPQPAHGLRVEEPPLRLVGELHQGLDAGVRAEQSGRSQAVLADGQPLTALRQLLGQGVGDVPVQLGPGARRDAVQQLLAYQAVGEGQLLPVPLFAVPPVDAEQPGP